MLELNVKVFALRCTALGLVGFGLFVAIYVIAAAPTRVASRLGLRGLKRQRVLSKNEAWAGIEPFVRWLGVRLSGLLDDKNRESLDEQISLAGDFYGLTPEEYVALSVISAFGGIIVGFVMGQLADLGSFTIVPGFILGAALPYMQISGAAQERLKLITRGVPYVVDLMALAMSAGLDFPGACRQVVEKTSNPDDPILEEFTLILQTLNLGRTRREALMEFARRAPVEVVKEFTGALVQAEERGNPVAEVLQIQATSSRTRRSVRAEELAAKAGVQIVGPLMLLFFCVLGLILGPAILNMVEGGTL